LKKYITSIVIIVRKTIKIKEKDTEIAIFTLEKNLVIIGAIVFLIHQLFNSLISK